MPSTKPETTLSASGQLSRVRFALIGVGLLWLIIWAAAALIGDGRGETITLNLMFWVLGTALGWLAGLFATPRGKNEATTFRDYLKGISTFISGYGLSKLDAPIKKYVESDIAASTSTTFMARVLILISSLIVAFLAVYMLREYSGPNSDDGTSGS